MASFKSFANEAQELKSHASALTNERISALITTFDAEILNARVSRDYKLIERAFNTLHVLWLNCRCLVRYFPNCRGYLSLETTVDGVYTLDVLDDIIERKIMTYNINPALCRTKQRYILLKRVEYMFLVVSDIFQFFKFSFRTDNHQKPDIFQTVDKDFIPDENTINQLAEVVGKRNKVDFEKFRAQINGEKEIISQSKFFDSSSDTDEAVDEDYNEDDNDNGY